MPEALDRSIKSVEYSHGRGIMRYRPAPSQDRQVMERGAGQMLDMPELRISDPANALFAGLEFEG